MAKVVKKLSVRWWLLLAITSASALALSFVVLGTSKPLGATSPNPPKALSTILVASTSSNCSTATFCLTGGTASGPIFPGAATQTLPLSFTNPYSVPLTITSLQVTFTNGFPTECASGAFQVNGAAATGNPPSVTFTPMSAPGSPLVIGQATTSGPTTKAYSGAQLGLANLGTSQDACQGLALVLSYTAQATFSTSRCITASQNGLTVSSGQVVCVSNGGKITGGATVQSGGVLLINGGTVTGGIKATGSAGINFCSENVTGGVTISGSTGEVVIGDGQSCAGGSITGGLSVSNGTAGVQIINNNITGGLTVTGNAGSTPGPGGISGQFVESNSISGGFTCTPNNTPALSDGGGVHPNSVSGQRTGSQCAGSF